ncbi:MAG: UxaA family hydrolase [Chloroflexi bacterium]|nr:UxaA family hydrolase [Chloroflexota bacterium]
MIDILGYRRSDGSLGIRNHVAVIYTVECAKVVAARIAAQFPNTQLFGRRTGCFYSGPIRDKLVALGRHPNVASALVVGLGCEYIDAAEVAEAIGETGKPTASLIITRSGGTLRSLEQGCKLLDGLVQAAYTAPRALLAVADLVVAMDCAGSDATSGLASNPAVGAAADLLVDAGATVYFFNIWKELIGVGDILAKRAVNAEIAAKLRAVCPDEGDPDVNWGNMQGGITTYREKAAGALAKGGTRPIQGVIDSFRRPERHGLYLQIPVPDSSEGESDPQCAMQMAAAGAHIVVETTGVGTVTGGVVAPVIKVCANPQTIALLGDDMDIDASPILLGEKTVAEVGQEIYAEILAVAAGKRTRPEMLGHFED